MSSTFTTGETGDLIDVGNTCGVLDNAEGCIFLQNLLASAVIEEVLAAVEAAGLTNQVDDSNADEGPMRLRMLVEENDKINDS
ncbi:hypothetical protein EV426DRAFT_612639 [Tirmania nivea]|nr:hypothetical protein EV426DRAFT_612639 [Tirmania nivea]